MANKQGKPHDVFFKKLLSDTNRSIAFLQEFLPVQMVEVIDWSTVHSVDSVYVHEHLSAYYSDVVFSVALKAQEGLRIRISLLIEHKSYPDRMVSFQLLNYLNLGYRQQLSGHKTSTKPFRPELIIPFLFYHGKSKWKPASLQDFFSSIPASLQEYIPTIPFIYEDLKRYSLEALEGIRQSQIKAAVLTWYYGHSKEEVLANFSRILGLAGEEEGNFLETVTVYIFSVIKITEEEFTQTINDMAEQKKEKVLTLYDRIVDRGLQQGKRQGLQEGKRQGLQEGKRQGLHQGMSEIIQRLFRKGMTELEIAEATGLDIIEVKHFLVKKN